MITYFPAFTIRESEIKGFERLAGPTKDHMFPIVSLQAWPRAKNGLPSQVQRSVDKLAEASGGRPLALDLAAPRADLASPAGVLGRGEMEALHDVSDGCRNWAEFIADTAHIPVFQWVSDASQATLQFDRLISLGRSIVFRFRRSQNWNLPQLQLLPKAKFAGHSILVVLDSEQISRSADLTVIGNGVQQAALSIAQHLDQASLSFVVIGSSFPAEFASIHPEYAEMPIRERQLHAMLNPSPPLLQAGIDLRYGDYAGVFADEKPTAFKGRPRVDLACPTQWIYHRRPETEGYGSAAQLVVGSSHWDEALMCWGAQEIRRAAAGNLQGLGSGTPWTAIRINMHLHQQAHFESGAAGGPQEEEWQD